MAKLYCALNNRQDTLREKMVRALDYNPGWKAKHFQDTGFMLGGLEIPSKKENDFWLETDAFVVAFDGEILSWNIDVPGQSVTEKLLALFITQGAGLTNFLNGTFVLIIWDKAKRVLNIFNDRYGLRPLYYAQYKNKTVFASEIKAILADGEFDRKYNINGVIDLLTYDYVLGDETLMEGVKVFPYAGHLLIKDFCSGFSIKRYWDYDFTEVLPEHRKISTYTWWLHDVFKTAVLRAFQGPLKVGLPLTGGLDSRAIAAMLDKSYQSLNTYTFGIRGCIDIALARKVSRLMGARHHVQEIQYNRIPEFMTKSIFYNDGLVNCNHAHIMNISESLSRNDQVAVTGFAGGMNRQTYSSYQNDSDLKVLAAHDLASEDIRLQLFDKSLEKSVRDGRQRFLALWNDIKIKNKKSALDYFNITQRQRKLINYGNIMMRNYVEVRTPYMDYDYVDFGLKMPAIFKDDGFLFREMLDRYHYPYARIMQEATGLPVKPTRWQRRLVKVKNMLLRKPVAKRRPAYDYNKWYRQGALKDFAQKVLFSQQFKSRGVFNQKEVIKMANDHFQGKKNYTPQLGVLITFELWNRMFIDGDIVRPEGLIYE